MMDDEDALRRGHQARRELGETEAAFERVRNAILNELAATSPALPEKILKLHLAAQNLSAVKQALMDVAINGQVAEHALASAGLTRPN